MGMTMSNTARIIRYIANFVLNLMRVSGKHYVCPNIRHFRKAVNHYFDGGHRANAHHDHSVDKATFVPTLAPGRRRPFVMGNFE